MRTVFAVLAAVTLAGCGGTDLPQKPLIQPDRVQLNFGSDFNNAVYVDTEPQETVQLKNGGQELLTIASVTITGTDAGLFTAALTGQSVESLKKAFLTITYKPKAAGKHSAKAVIVSNSSENPTLEIPLNATAVNKT